MYTYIYMYTYIHMYKTIFIWYNIGYTMVQWHTQIPQHPIVHHHFFPYLSFVYLYLTLQCWIVLAANWANPISVFLALKPARSLLLLCWAEGILQ